MAKLVEGKAAPSFSLDSSKGTKIKLADFKGKKKVVLYFYPKDNTPGCTKESCDFRDSIKRFQRQDAVVLGVSADSLESHDQFIQKFKLPFPLLSDPEKGMLKKYGVWQQKSLYGRKFMGIVRTTVVIDKKGKIAKIFPKVKVDGHADEVLQVVKEA